MFTFQKYQYKMKVSSPKWNLCGTQSTSIVKSTVTRFMFMVHRGSVIYVTLLLFIYPLKDALGDVIGSKKNEPVWTATVR